jgi:hypothetical protein
VVRPGRRRWLGGEEAPKPSQFDVDALEISFDLVAPPPRRAWWTGSTAESSPPRRPRAPCSRTRTWQLRSALLGALVALRRALRDLPPFTPFLAELGARHARYGVVAEHYP